eukprot:13698219-Heterocapsa_arctica.AAC.1
MARRYDGRGPCPLRDAVHIMGLPNLSSGDKLKVLIGNKLMRAFVSLMLLCISLNFPCAIANPHNSRLWLSPPMAYLRTRQ